MKAVLHKGGSEAAAAAAAAGLGHPGSPKHRVGGSHGVAGAVGVAGATAVDDDEVSDYTDADESISAPTEFLAEFLSAIMGKDYPTALKYCKLILQYEPNNRTAREFYPLIVEKLVQSTIDESQSDSEDSSSGGSGSLTGSASDEDASSSSVGSLSEDEDEEEDDEDGGGGRRHNDNSEYGDTDGTTASYSSLEDEEADPADTQIALANDTEEDCNGNEVSVRRAPVVARVGRPVEQACLPDCLPGGPQADAG
ncbi:hypothetical protein ONE63_003773 [Megalurothrips usitatus]|uniref:Glutamate-rich protein 2 n=1 Tax=Megalurothrips usitatus TaxID=439358 RepID=A0AAV7X7M6_9NEOP|nr:hypothetical protein ONE63_003773 [Megalurothrips usitatus]